MRLFTTLQATILTASIFMISACGDSYSRAEKEDKVTQPKVVKRVAPPGLHINEFLASNTDTNMDSDFYKFSDWIEIFNNTTQAIDISGYYLSDKASNPKLWRVPASTIIPANGYLLIWADKKDTKKRELHTNFKLSSKKGSVLLSDSNGNLIDNIAYTNKQAANISCVPSQGTVVYTSPTPAQANGQAFTTNGQSTKPLFSEKGGFYPSSKTISLSAEGGAEIYYTTNGERPTSSSTRYTQPILVDHSTVIKAIAKNNSSFPSKVESHSYFIDEQSTLPVVSLSLDEKYLFDDTIGIYTKGSNGTRMVTPCANADNNTPFNFFQKWKRPAHISYFKADKKEAFSLDLDIGIAGQCSRHYDKKAFKFGLDSKYGTKSITYKLYHDKESMKIKDFKIRPGNKGYEIGDILAAKIAKEGHLNVDYQAYTAVRMFVNGKYWGLYNIRERKGDKFIKSNYPNVDTDKLDIIKNSGLIPDNIKAGNRDDYKIMYATANAHNFSKLSQLVDIDNLIDYLCIMIYSGNEDWSFSNARAWKEKKAGAKWRWMLDDLDEGFKGDDRDSESGIFTDNINGDGILHLDAHEFGHLFKTLMSDAATKKKFINRLNQLLNTTFAPANINRLIDEILSEREAILMLETKTTGSGIAWFDEKTEIRPGQFESYNILKGSYEDYKEQLKNFANKRADIVKGQLQKAIDNNWTNTIDKDDLAGAGDSNGSFVYRSSINQ